MQLRQSSVHGDRPKYCPHCRHPGLHHHGSYKRHSKAEALTDEDQVAIQRYLCPPCGCTCSVLPDDMLPYSPVSASQTQKHFDAAFNGGPAPPATEKERGCFHRALRRFDERVAPLRAVLGQMLKVVCPTAQQLWRSLRKWGNLAKILQLLAQNFKTSLLGDYRCLKHCQ